jgi:hypothetical protein
MVELDKTTSRGCQLISLGEIDAFCQSRKLQLIKLIGVCERDRYVFWRRLYLELR